MAPMTNAERQKKYRQKLKENNPEKFEEKRIAHLEKVKQNKRKISELTDSEKEKRRRKWREYSAKYYEKQKNNNEDEIQEENIRIKKKQKKCRKNIRNLKKELLDISNRLQIQIKKNRSLQKQILRLKKKAETLESDDSCCLLTERCKHKQEIDVPQSLSKEELTPMKKTEHFIESLGSVNKDDKEKLKEKILELNVLSNSLNLSYKSATKTEKQTFKKIVNNPITQKYKIVTKLTKKTIGLKGRIRKSEMIIEKKREAQIQEIHNFFNRDDVTRCTAGKKETKTKNKCKAQRKYLTDSIKNLYKKYKEEGGKASYSSLLRHRPFYVLNPKLANCESCACVKHENFTFIVSKLHKIGILKTAYIKEILTELSCDLNSKACMYGDCSECSKKVEEIETNIDNIETTKVIYWQWVLKKIQYQKKKQDGTLQNLETKKYKKEVIENSIKELILKYQEEAKKFKRHYFNIIHQQRIFKESKTKIRSDEAVIICDFSENYNCRYSSEIQGMHFGSSRNQITLHTGVLYVKDQEPISFCTLSACNEHNPYSIWAHLTPVINALKSQFPTINKIHFFSDGPSTQYRQKINFVLFSKLTKEFGFSHCTWNYFEASHGKNAADGIGGAIKRILDSRVAYGTDIPDAETAYEILKKSSKICLHFVTESDIYTLQEFLSCTIKPLKGTMSVHQIVTTEDESVIKYRDVSCLCGEIRGFCSCYNIKDHRLIAETKKCSEENENKKVTVLSDVKLTEQNKIFIENLPLSLTEVKLNIPLVFGNSATQIHNRKGKNTSDKYDSRSNVPKININEYGCLSSDEQTEVSKSESINKNKRKGLFSNSVSKGNRKNINIKRKRRSSNSSTTSESAEISIHSDSDLQNALTDIEDEECNKENFRGNNLKDYDKTIHVFNKIDIKENVPLEEIKEIKKINSAEEIEVKNIDGKEQETEINRKKQQEFHNIDGESEFKQQKSNLPKNITDTQQEIYNKGDNVLVRYYIRKSWRYYIGIIKDIHVDSVKLEKLYTISFYKTYGPKQKISFRKPLIEDRDTVPENSIVKLIEILQFSEKPEAYVLYHDEDLVYFT